MQRRNWLELSRKLVDQYDLDYTLSAIQEALGEQALSFFGEGVLITTTYPSPFPITMNGVVLGGSVGNGIAYDPNGQLTSIDPGDTTSKDFTITAADPSLDRWDLLVIRYFAKGDTPVPKPSDPITTIDLNLIDDFELAVVAGTPSVTPAYPAKGALDIILAGLKVHAGDTLGTQVSVDLSIREMGLPDIVHVPVFIRETPTGLVNGTNQNFTLSQEPLNGNSILVFLDDRVLDSSEWSLLGTTVTYAVAPAIGQSVYAWYVVDSPTSINPLSGFQETPTPAADGIVDTFNLTGKPADQASTLVFVNGLLAEHTTWDLIQGALISSIKFKPGNIPAPGQGIYVFYLVNPATVGVGGGGGGGGDGAFVVYGSPGSPIQPNPVAGIIAPSDQRSLQYVSSTGGVTPITANPQVTAGSVIGQELLLMGCSNTNYCSLVDGNGLSLNGPINLTLKQSLYLVWSGSTWDEVSRR